MEVVETYRKGMAEDGVLPDNPEAKRVIDKIRKLMYNTHMMKTYERTLIKLLDGMPKAKPFGRGVINGKWITGTLSQHRTRQGVAWRRFIKMRQRVNTLVK